jgi:hypothetical protein
MLKDEEQTKRARAVDECIEIKEDAAAELQYNPRELPTPFHEDGSVAEI